jgi:hypothetical protein
MFGDIFIKKLKFLRILYNFYQIWVIFKVILFYSIEFGRIIFRKNGNWQIMFREKENKISL